MRKLVIIPIVVAAVVGGALLYGVITLLDDNAVVHDENYPCRLTDGAPEGPYYITGAPFKDKISEGFDGPRLILTGKVMNKNCEPIPGALLDIWQTDSNGDYYFEGNYGMRGKVTADKDGNYKIDTILPVNYEFLGSIRPAHIHMKIFDNMGNDHTTQLYFAGDAHFDKWTHDSLVLKLTPNDGIEYATYDLVILTKP